LETLAIVHSTFSKINLKMALQIATKHVAGFIIYFNFKNIKLCPTVLYIFMLCFKLIFNTTGIYRLKNDIVTVNRNEQ
jgi:hypothetical protein